MINIKLLSDEILKKLQKSVVKDNNNDCVIHNILTHDKIETINNLTDKYIEVNFENVLIHFIIIKNASDYEY